MEHFWRGFEKKAATKNDEINPHASHGIEIAGLSTLAAPHFTKKPWSHGAIRASELAGLGLLAIPSIYHFGKVIKKKLDGK